MTKVQRYKVGYYTDEWGMSSNTPCLVPDDSGYAVKFEDYCKLETELAEKDAEVEKLKRLNSSYSSLTKAQGGQLTALRNRLYELRGADKTLDSEREANAILTEQLAALKEENESLKRDAERWRAYQKRKQDLLDRGFLRSPLREEAELNPAMAQGEK